MNIHQLMQKENRPWLILGAVLLWLLYQTGMAELWLYSEEYGHGLMVVALVCYILYLRWNSINTGVLRGRSFSLVAGILAILLIVLGQSSGIGVLTMYGVWMFAIAIIIAYGGLSLLRNCLAPLFIIFLLIPLPNPFGPMLTSKLQLLSSQIGVWFIRFFGGTVYLEGNVLDMGGTQLLVAEACAGLRYLFPLMSLGGIAAYIFKGPQWMRWLIFLVTIPITVILNSLRIGLTGILTEKWGTQHTEGFLHFFEGWVVFMVATVLLVLFCWVLLKLYDKNTRLFDAFKLEADGIDVTVENVRRDFPKLSGQILIAIIVFAAILSYWLASRVEVLPTRENLNLFPREIASWIAKEQRLASTTEAVAGASEYYYADYFNPDVAGGVNVYVAFYITQRKGNIPHSPKVCIPGDGWSIDSITPVVLKANSGKSFTVNRLLISKGEVKTVAYYWLKQGEQVYTQELLARIDLVRSSLLNNRTDGALVRLVTQVGAQEDLSVADARLAQFAKPFLDELPKYVPD